MFWVQTSSDSTYFGLFGEVVRASSRLADLRGKDAEDFL